MPRLQHASHEAFAKEYASELSNGKPAIGRKIYKKVFANTSNVSADASASRLLSSVKVQDRIQEIIGLKNPPEKISDKLAELIDAKKQSVGQDGQIIELKDNSTQLGAINTWCKIMGVNGQEGSVTDARSVHFNIENGTNILFDSMIKKLDSLCNGIMNVGQSSTDQSSPSNDTNITQLLSTTETNTSH